MSDIIARIKHKLAYLQPHNSGYVSEDHYQRKGIIAPYPYGVYMTHTEDDIAAFEAHHQIRLPEDYRCFIMEIGSEGYNPGNNLYSPLESMLSMQESAEEYQRLSEIEANYDHYDNYDEIEFDQDVFWKDHSPVYGTLGNPFLFEKAMNSEAIKTLRQSLQKPYEAQHDGYLPIADTPEGGWYLLIIAGAERGHIWYQDDARLAPVLLIEKTLYHPAFDHYRAANDSSAAQHVTFTQWYETWLDQQILMAQERWRTRGEDVPPLILPAE